MKKVIGSLVAGVALVVFVAACVDSPTEYTVKLETPKCVSPPPLLSASTDTLSLGCPFRYIDETTGDTLPWVPVF